MDTRIRETRGISAVVEKLYGFLAEMKLFSTFVVHLR